MIIKNNLLLIILVIIGIFLHFYNLNWGAPFYFHPDERNIASSVSQLEFPDKMNPNFFAYGSLPIYTIYFTGIFLNALANNAHIQRVSFENAIIISRFYSAIFAMLLIPILFLLGKKLKDEKTGLLAALLTTLSVGFIQFSHFGTFEIWLTFFSVILFSLCLQQINLKTVLFMGIIFGILVSIKISSLVLFLISIILITSKSDHKKIIYIIKNLLLFTVTFIFVFFITNPFVILDVTSFKNTINYESSLAIGTLPVFYTGEFFNTIPALFQFKNIYPFLLNPLTTSIFIISFIYICWELIQTKNKSYAILIAFYLILFISQAFLFAKWTRYMIPTLPFIYLIVAIGLTNFLQSTKKIFGINYLALITIVFINMLFSLSYFITVFVKQDSRIAAKAFAIKNIPSDAPILSEVYDIGIVPLNNNFTNIKLFNFYDLDQKSPDWTEEKLNQELINTDYIIIPSQRILKTRLINEKEFPLGHNFYSNLFNGKLPYQKIYETPCDIFCKIIYLGHPVFSFEQTANVFDRPIVYIFKKN